MLLGILEWCITSVSLMLSAEGFWCSSAKRAELKSVACLTWTVTYVELLCCSEETEAASKCCYVILYVKGQAHWKPVWKEGCIPVPVA